MSVKQSTMETGQPRLTRYEVSRLLGLRSLALSHGEPLNVPLPDGPLAQNTLYLAALELFHKKLDAKIERKHGQLIHVAEAKYPRSLLVYLDTEDGGSRSYE